MSKTQIKLCAAVEATMRVLSQASVMSATLDVSTFRNVFKLTSMRKKEVASAIEKVLHTDGIVHQFGGWVIAEIEHPQYQLTQLSANRIVLFHKQGDPYPSGTVESGFPKSLGNDTAVPKGEGLDMGWEPSDASEALRDKFSDDELMLLYKADLVGPMVADELTLSDLEEKLDVLTDLDPPVPQRKNTDPVEWAEAWAAFTPKLKVTFTSLELEVLFAKGLIGPGADEPPIAISVLQTFLEGLPETLDVAVPEGKKKSAPKAKKAPPKPKKAAPKAKKATKK